MAEILPQSPTMLRISPPSSPLESPLDGSEVAFVDAQEQPFHLSTHLQDTTLAVAENRHSFANTLRLPHDESSGLDAPKGHSRKHKSLALPAFSFNPGAALDNANENTSPPTSPKSELPPSPSKRKHRRVHSELVGGDSRHQSPITSVGPNVDKITEELAKREVTEPTISRTPSKGHRHRRSGAVSSRDLSAIQRPASSGTGQEATSTSGPPTPTFGSQFLSSAGESPKSSPVQASFSDSAEVAMRRSLPTLKGPEHISGSRPIHSSDGVENRSTLTPSQYLESIRPATVATTSNRPSLTSFEPLPLLEQPPENLSEESLLSASEFPSVSIVEDAEDDILSTIEDEGSVLDVDFDNDPTAAIIVAEGSTLSASSPRSPTFDFEAKKCPETVIDLDSANDVEEATTMTADDLRSLRAKSFSAARHSMHSGGMDAATARLNHHRTESVPSMSTAFFERPQMPRNHSQTASERGFEMENVFEEEEEDMSASGEYKSRLDGELRQPLGDVGLGLGLENDITGEVTLSGAEASAPAYVDVTGHELDDENDTPTPTNDSDIPSRSHTIRHTTSNRHSLACSTEDTTFEEARCSDEQTRSPPDRAMRTELAVDPAAVEQRPVSQPLPQLTAPPWNTQPEDTSFGSTPQDQSISSTWSTPKLDTAATSLHEAHLNLPRSNADGVSLSSEGVPSGIPSLVSSMSTMSMTRRYAGSTASPSTPGGTQTEHSTASMSSQQDKRRKRSSIQSLSQLLGYSGHGKSNLSVEQSSRCQTSSGLSSTEVEPAGKEKRRKRLSRALKFWKSKDGVPSG